MYLKHLSLTHFRNYTRLELDLQARIHILQGDNAQGKTNLLESIYYLATTRTPLAALDRQLINWVADAEVIPYARIEGLFSRASSEHTIDITLVKEQLANGEAELPTFRRQILLDGVPRRALDIVGLLNVVLFLPEDVTLVAGSPGERRRYLDITLCQIDPAYCRTLSRYNRVLTQRNALLKQIRERLARPQELDYWDEQLAALGAYVLARRLWAVRWLDEQAREIHATLTGGGESLTLTYQGTVGPDLPEAFVRPPESFAALDVTQLEEPFRRALHAARREETARAMTTIGPHRDDLRFLINQIDATVYGSRGQQRTAALALKLAEVDLMHDQTGEMPILLLDDVASELDSRRTQFLLDTISRAQQVLITATSLSDLNPSFVESAVLWRVTAGSVVLQG